MAQPLEPAVLRGSGAGGGGAASAFCSTVLPTVTLPAEQRLRNWRDGGGVRQAGLGLVGSRLPPQGRRAVSSTASRRPSGGAAISASGELCDRRPGGLDRRVRRLSRPAAADLPAPRGVARLASGPSGGARRGSGWTGPAPAGNAGRASRLGSAARRRARRRNFGCGRLSVRQAPAPLPLEGGRWRRRTRADGVGSVGVLLRRAASRRSARTRRRPPPPASQAPRPQGREGGRGVCRRKLLQRLEIERRERLVLGGTLLDLLACRRKRPS